MCHRLRLDAKGAMGIILAFLALEFSLINETVLSP